MQSRKTEYGKCDKGHYSGVGGALKLSLDPAGFLPFGLDGRIAAFIMRADRWNAGEAILQRAVTAPCGRRDGAGHTHCTRVPPPRRGATSTTPLIMRARYAMILIPMPGP